MSVLSSPPKYASMDVVELSKSASSRAAGRIRDLENTLDISLTKNNLAGSGSPAGSRVIAFTTPAVGRRKSVFSRTPSTEEAASSTPCSSHKPSLGSRPSTTLLSRKTFSRLQHRNTPLSSSSSAKQLQCSTPSSDTPASSLTTSSSWSSLKSRPASAAFERGESTAPGSQTRSRIVSLPEHVKRDVKKLFDSFALQHKRQEAAQRKQPRPLSGGQSKQAQQQHEQRHRQQPRGEAQPQGRQERVVQDGTPKPAQPDKAQGHKAQPHKAQPHKTPPSPGSRQEPGAEVARLGPTRQSFAQLLRVYNRRASSAEIGAMLQVVEEPLGRLTSKAWAAETTQRHGDEIRRIFASADRDGSGGIDVSEFAASVEEATGLDDLELRRLFDAADKDKDGGACCHASLPLSSPGSPALALSSPGSPALALQPFAADLSAFWRADGLVPFAPSFCPRAVLDMDEFMHLVSSSTALSQSFDAILDAAKERRERTEHERLSTIFRHVPEGGFQNAKGSTGSPSRGRLRPSLFHLRSLHEVSLPWQLQPTYAPSSPHKSQLIRSSRRVRSPDS